MTLFTCRNSSGSSPPMMVKPKPMVLFCSAVDRKLPFSWVGSRVNACFSAKDTERENQWRSETRAEGDAFKPVQGGARRVGVAGGVKLAQRIRV